MAGRGELTDEVWERIRPLLPSNGRRGRQWRDHRTVVNGILSVLRTGIPWRSLPERYGSWKTVSSRFYRWQKAGVWDRVLSALQRRADAEGRLGWTLHFVDSTVVRAHQHAAGACKEGRRTWPWVAPGAGSGPRSTSSSTPWATRSSSS